jgi:hypothetical protein
VTKKQLNEAYHKLANESMAIQRRTYLRDQHREVFDMLWRIDYDKAERESME